MPGRVPIDPFVSLQVDQNFHSEGDFNEEQVTPQSLHIPRSKYKKSKNRRRNSDTIWTIVHEQENTTPSKSSKQRSSKNNSKHLKETSKNKSSKDYKKATKSSGKNSISTPTDSNRKSFFLDNPIFETELKNWTLPRVELWCKDPSCQINVQLWREYCRSHQDQLTQLQVQELLQQQQYHHHHEHQNQQHQRSHPPPLTITSRSQRFSSVSSPHYIYEDSVDNSQSHSVPHELCNKSGACAAGAASNHHECRHPFHHEEEQYFYHHHHETNHGNMHINMSIGASTNNLSARDANATSVSTGGGSFSSPVGGNTSGNKTYNNINHPPPPPPPLPPSDSVIISVPSGASSSKTNNSNSTKTASFTSVSVRQQVTSSTGEAGGDFNGLSSSSSSSTRSGSGTDVSSGSTFVTGFDSSESRMSSVPSSMSKPPHPKRIMEGNNNRSEANSYNNNNSTNNKLGTQSSDHVIGYGDTNHTATGGYPSLPYIQQSGYRKPGVCPSCNGLVPPATNHHLVPVDPIISSGGDGHGHGPIQHKSDNAFWNFTKFQHPLQRDHSFHSVGGFTLNGQYNTQVKKRRVVKFCSSHKIALVVSTFSLMVTVGLIITLILMKKRGMMDTMDMVRPT